MTKRFDPKVSFVVFAYNHEGYIRQAVESALAQTYSPLEIILSDDCSTDSTFEIMRDIVSNYKGGHVVRLNRNTENMGLAKHFNKVMEMASGEFIVAAGGDDISKPQRTEVLVDAWNALGRGACSIFSNASVIDEGGAFKGLYYNNINYARDMAEFISKGACWVGGFSHGFSKVLYSMFGPMPEGTFQEDGVISFRAILCSGIHYIDEDLVQYRRHENNSYSTQKYSKFKKLCASEYAMVNGRINDIGLSQELSESDRAAALIVLRRELRKKMLLSKVPGLAASYFVLRCLKGYFRQSI